MWRLEINAKPFLGITNTIKEGIGGFHVTSSPPCWWTVNKRSLISSLCLSTSICSFHHCFLCLPRLHENHLYAYSSIINSPAKKLKLTQKVNNAHLFQFTVCPLFNSLFGGHVFSIIIIIIIIII